VAVRLHQCSHLVDGAACRQYSQQQQQRHIVQDCLTLIVQHASMPAGGWHVVYISSDALRNIRHATAKQRHNSSATFSRQQQQRQGRCT
jgi:hypothetical protein